MESSTQFKQYADIVWRRKWWVVVPTVLAAIASLVILEAAPKVYRATTTILVTRQSVPDDIVRSTVTLRIEERMRSLQVQILSRSYLERIAREFRMIPTDAGETAVEKTCDQLAAQIFPEVDTHDFSWFRISVEDSDAERAAGIANRLAALFMEQNSAMRASQAAGTLLATENWEEKYRTELAQRDKAISEFKQQNLEGLPDQQPANLMLLSSAQNRIAQLTSDIQSRNDRIVALRGQQQGERANGVAPDEATRLAAAQRELAELLVTYTEENPAVRRKREQIADLVLAQSSAAASGSPASVAATARHAPMSAQIAATENEIAALERERTRERAKYETYRERVGNSALLQLKLVELNRDYDLVKHQFDVANDQKEQAQRSQDLEETKKGAQFQIQDRAYAPTAPYEPDFLPYLLKGIGLGFVIGIGVIVAWEFVDQSVRGEDECATLFPDLPVYGVIPSLDVDRKARRRWAQASAGAAGRVAAILFPLVPGWIAWISVWLGRTS